MSRAPRIVTIGDDPQGFASIRDDARFAEIEDHPQTGAYARLYYPAVHGDACRDLSFAILVDEAPAAIVLVTLLDGKLCLYGLPLRVFYADGADAAVRANATRLAMTELDRLAADFSVAEISVREPAASLLSPLGDACLARGARAAFKLVAQVELPPGPDAWRKNLRKSYRSLLNWGKRELRIETPASRLEIADGFERFRAFHREVAGRVTRGEDSWRAMEEFVANGGGELVLAHLEDRLVSANLFIDGKKTSIYMTGVYDRNLFDKPLAHYPLWHSLERARTRGLHQAELGDVFFKGDVSDKEQQIGYFKKGFATHLETHFFWVWRCGAGDPDEAVSP